MVVLFGRVSIRTTCALVCAERWCGVGVFRRKPKMASRGDGVRPGGATGIAAPGYSAVDAEMHIGGGRSRSSPMRPR